jgi:hypothetical protein
MTLSECKTLVTILRVRIRRFLRIHEPEVVGFGRLVWTVGECFIVSSTMTSVPQGLTPHGSAWPNSDRATSITERTVAALVKPAKVNVTGSITCRLLLPINRFHPLVRFVHHSRYHRSPSYPLSALFAECENIVAIRRLALTSVHDSIR